MLALYKKPGETPLAALEQFRKMHPEYANATLSYAGRLDPFAEGVLLILVGDENNEREKYLALKKTYEVEVLFGVETDTYDPLGIIVRSEPKEPLASWNQFTGTYPQKYPSFSSKTVSGKPLHAYAREGMEVEAPTHEVTIHSIQSLERYTKKGSEIAADVHTRVGAVVGDFRQEEICASWEAFGKQHAQERFHLERIRVYCASGAYMRSLAHEAGGIAYHILRTEVGPYGIDDALVS